MIEKITLIGLGAMGCFFAPRLYQCYGTGFRVLAHGERKARLEADGVWINGVPYRFPLLDTPAEDPADLIIVATKDTGLEQALADIRGQVGPDTIILPILNGVESEEKTAAVYGWEHVLYALMRVSIVMKDGHADFQPESGRVHFGDLEGTGSGDSYVPSARVAAVAEALERAKIPYQIEPDPIYSMWWKYMANVGENMTCALLGIPFGGFRSSEDANWLRHAAMQEVAAIANAKGIGIGAKEMAYQDSVVMQIPPLNRPSTLQDIENHRKTEVEMFSGTVCRLGRELGIPTPVNEVLLHGIRTLEAKYL